jgi:hypothetical protein
VVALLATQAAQPAVMAAGPATRHNGSTVVAQLAGDPVTGLQATGAAGNRVVLSWVNPSPVTEVAVRYSTTAYPATPSEGTPVDTGGVPVEELAVKGLTNHRTYFFSVFALSGGVWSAPEQISFAPYVCPKVSAAMDVAGLQVEKLWMACSAPSAHDSHNALNTILPRLGPAQALITTGSRDVAVPPSDGALEGRHNHAGLRGAHDVSILRIIIDVPAAHNCVRFDYVLASEGYPESVGQPQRDGFVAQLDRDDWRVNNGTLDIVDNIAELSTGEYASVGSALFDDPAKVYPAGTGPGHNGTGYDGMTQPLNVSSPATPGKHHLFLSIFDRAPGDAVDTAAFMDRLRTTNDADCAAGTNRWPAAAADNVQTPGGTQATVAVLANDTDDDGDDLVITSAGPVADHGSVTCDADSCSYTPDRGFVGTDRFTYTVSDGNGGNDTATATVRVNDRAPVPVNDTMTAISGTATDVRVLANDADPDGHSLSVTSTHPAAAHGTVSCSSAICTYTSHAGYTGGDSFRYAVGDGHGGTATATVAVTVSANPATAVTINPLSRTSLTWPQTVTVTGGATAAGGGPARGVDVQLVGSTSGGPFRLIGTATTAADGTIRFVHRPTTGTTYRWQVAGKASVRSLTRVVQVRPAITMSLSRPAMAVGSKVKITGKTSPSRKGTPVLLQRRAGKAWQTVQKTTVKRVTRTLKPTGGYAFLVGAKSSGVFQYRVVVKTDAGRMQAISAPRTVVAYDAAITQVSRSADEFVVVKNTGRVKLNIKGWKLTNKGGAAAKLPKRFIKPGKVLRIHTGSGRSNATNLYLGRRPMFSNSHDRVSLVDRSKFRVSTLAY